MSLMLPFFGSPCIHYVPIDVMPKLKSTQIEHNSTEPYVTSYYSFNVNWTDFNKIYSVVYAI